MLAAQWTLPSYIYDIGVKRKLYKNIFRQHAIFFLSSDNGLCEKKSLANMKSHFVSIQLSVMLDMKLQDYALSCSVEENI